MLFNARRYKHFLAMAFIGDGVLALIRPEHDVHAWDLGPAPWRNLMKALARRPGLTRCIGAMEIAAGITWALTHQNDD